MNKNYLLDPKMQILLLILSRIDELTATIRSQEFERQKHEDELIRRNKEEKRELEKLQEKHRATERDMESVTQALMKLVRLLKSYRLSIKAFKYFYLN